MTSLRDQAAAGGPEVTLAADLPQQDAARIVSAQLTAADDITGEEQFPTFGQFLEVEPVDADDDADPRFWECPASLAGAIVELVDDQDGDLEETIVDVRTAAKTPDGEWRFEIAVEADERAEE